MTSTSKGPPGERAPLVVLHVGTPKTGTTYLQTVLSRNRTLLRENGVLVPGTEPDSAFLAAVDLMGGRWGGSPLPRAAGQWTTLVEEVKAWKGAALVSSELLALGSADQAAEAVAAFAPTPVTVVITARDLLRQLPAEWQENVKHGRFRSFATFWAMASDPEETHEAARWFRQVQDLPRLVERWSAAVSAERVRLVTVPPHGAPAHRLWDRFATACEIGVIPGLDHEVVQDNSSLDAVTTWLLRAVNRSLDADPLRIDQRDRLLKGLLAERILAPQTSPDARIQVPYDVATAVLELAQVWRTELAESGCTVIGDLDELTPVPPEGTEGPDDPDDAPADQVATVAAASIAGLLRELGSVADDRHRASTDLLAERDRLAAAIHESALLQRELDATREQLDETHRLLDTAREQLREHRDLPPGGRVRRLFVELEGQIRVVSWLLGLYRSCKALLRRASGTGAPPQQQSGDRR